MKINGTQLDTEAGLIKARSGSYGDGLFRYSKDDYAIYAGGLKFPLAPLNKFTPAINGICKVLDGKFTIALDYMLHTPNVISFEVDANLTEGQQASYTIQHGERSVILTNLAGQKTTMAFETGKPVIITAINYATGAVTTTALAPEMGQAYKLSSTSSTRVKGELKTVGGELISGGELTTYCAETGVNLNKVTVLSDYTNSTYKRSFVVSTPNANKAPYLLKQDLYMDYYVGIGDGGAKMQGLNDEVEQILAAPVKLVRISEINVGGPAGAAQAISNAMTVVPGQEFVAPSTASDYILIVDLNYGVVLPGTELYFLVGTGRNLSLKAGSQYRFELQRQLLTPEVTFEETPGTISMLVRQRGIARAIITGPYDPECLREEQIDTRYSYTTPVITTDTRRTIYEIALTVTPLN